MSQTVVTIEARIRIFGAQLGTTPSRVGGFAFISVISFRYLVRRRATHRFSDNPKQRKPRSNGWSARFSCLATWAWRALGPCSLGEAVTRPDVGGVRRLVMRASFIRRPKSARHGRPNGRKPG